MSAMFAFAVTFGLALAVWLIFNRFGTPGMRAFLDDLANRAKMPGQDRVAQIGDSGAQRDTFGQLKLPLTVGVRGTSTVAVFALLYLLNLHSENASFSPIPRAYFWEGYMAASAIAAWYMGYIWTYELRLDGDRLIVPTWGFGAREYDLKQLIRVEDDGAYILRLYFDGGSKAEVMKFVRGRADFMNALERRVPL